MEALINAGGKGTRMGDCGIEKPMQVIGGEPVVMRVVNAMRSAKSIDRVLVSVSEHTSATARYLEDNGIETIHTSGDDFMMDLHDSFSVLNGKYVLTSPSDIPMMTSTVIDKTVEAFRPEMQSMIVYIDAGTVREMGVIPSYKKEINGKEWVISGLSIMDREATLEGTYLNEEGLFTDWQELAVNVNTQGELSLARKLV
ncbi:MAG: NTP transferase domain-containing protein [Methanomethylophilus sp.]|nr:NTP transferase domain-containing protein [Methanomethylophilus sp.]